MTSKPGLEGGPSEAFVRSMIDEFGCPLMLYDMTAFERNYFEFLEAFTRRYARTRIAYSYKTNYTPALCRCVDEWGGLAEVVSGLEYELARSLGVPGSRIVFNGPWKTAADLQRAVDEDAVINVDEAYQLPVLRELAKGRPAGSDVRVGLRITFELPGAETSRFGFHLENGGLEEGVEFIRQSPGLKLSGLHCHFLTAGRSAADYERIAKRMIEAARALGVDGGLEFLDIGGGFFSKMSPALKSQFDVPIPDFADYGKAIGDAFSAAYGKEGGPELIVEPGLCLTADISTFVTRVMDVKRSADRKLAVVMGSFYDIKPTGSARNLPIGVMGSNDGEALQGPIDIVGATCMEHDVLHRGYDGALARGDVVVFRNTGAYTNVLRPLFINSPVPIVGYDSRSGEARLLRRKMTAADFLSSYSTD